MSVSLSLARPVFLASTALLALAASSAPAAAKAVIRPIEDFVVAQGTYCLPPDLAGPLPAGAIIDNGCVIFVPPIPNFVGFFSSDRCASVDYAGLADLYLGGELGTTTRGTVLERPHRDGRVEVKIQLRTRNALTWVIQPEEGQDCDYALDPLLFGARAPDVAGGAAPALCDASLQVVFFNTAPGAPLPDLEQLLFAPEEGQSLHALSLRCNATGELHEAFGVPDGTPGRANIVQIGTLFRTSFKGKGVEDGFPVERIDLHEVGH